MVPLSSINTNRDNWRAERHWNAQFFSSFFLFSESQGIWEHRLKTINQGCIFCCKPKVLIWECHFSMATTNSVQAECWEAPWRSSRSRITQSTQTGMTVAVQPKKVACRVLVSPKPSFKGCGFKEIIFFLSKPSLVVKKLWRNFENPSDDSSDACETLILVEGVQKSSLEAQNPFATVRRFKNGACDVRVFEFPLRVIHLCP